MNQPLSEHPVTIVIRTSLEVKTHHTISDYGKFHQKMQLAYHSQSRPSMISLYRVSAYVTPYKFQTRARETLLPILKIVTRTAHAV